MMWNAPRPPARGAALLMLLAASSAGAQTASGLSGTTPPSNAPISGAPVAGPAPMPSATGGSSPAAATPAVQKAPPKSVYRDLPSNARLDASSQRIDRQIRRGICVGC